MKKIGVMGSATGKLSQEYRRLTFDLGRAIAKSVQKGGLKMFQTRFLLFSFIVVLSFVVFSHSVRVPSAEAEGIGGVTAVAHPQDYSGRCPHKIKFTGRIEVSAYPMVLNYHWERSDGAKSPVKMVKVPNAHTRSVTVVDYWQIGSKGQHAEVWEKLIVNSGNTHMTSAPAAASISCR